MKRLANSDHHEVIIDVNVQTNYLYLGTVNKLIGTKWQTNFCHPVATSPSHLV